MEYKNLFDEMSSGELKEYYQLYLEWNKKGVLADNPLGKIRDKYCDMHLSVPLMVLELDLLREIAKRWNTQ